MLALLFCLVFLAQQNSGPMEMSPNFKYAYIGKFSVDVSKQIVTTNQTVWPFESPLSLVIPFPSSLNNTILFSEAILSDFQLINTKQGVNIIVDLFNNSYTDMLVYLYSYSPRNIAKLSINYLLFNYKANFVANFAAFRPTIPVNKNISSNSSTTFKHIQSLTISFNLTGGVSIYLVLSGMMVSSTTSENIIDFQNTATLLDSSTAQIVIRSQSPTPTNILALSYLIMFFNTAFFAESNYCNFQVDSFQAYNQSSFTFSTKNLDFLSFNTYVGLQSLSISGQDSLNFSYLINEPSSFTIGSNQQLSYVVSSFVFYLYYCDYLIPYYDSTTQLCYDQCPTGTQSSDSLLSCISLNLTSLTGQTSSGSTGSGDNTGIIVGSVVGSVVLIVTIIIIICICHKRTKDQRKFDYDYSWKKRQQKPNNSLNQLNIKQEIPRAIYIFGQDKDLQPPIYQIIHNLNKINQCDIQLKQREGDREEVHSPVHYPIPDIETREIEWQQQEQPLQSTQQCCICLRPRPFMKSSCNHAFHINCLIDWRYSKMKYNKGQIEQTCPLCREVIQSKGKFYCQSCGKKYIFLELNKKIKVNDITKWLCDVCIKIMPL